MVRTFELFYLRFLRTRWNYISRGIQSRWHSFDNGKVCTDSLIEQESNLRHGLITFLLVASTVVVGLTTCELGMILELGGGLGGSFVAFIIPAGLWIRSNKLSGSALTRRDLILYSSIVAFGVSLLVSTIGLQIGDYFDVNKVRKDCKFV
jgi:hypothetical protein